MDAEKIETGFQRGAGLTLRVDSVVVGFVQEPYELPALQRIGA